MDTIASRHEPPDTPIMTAQQAIEGAKKAALAETMRLIGLNVTHGSVMTHSYPVYVRDYIRSQLSAAGYGVEDGVDRTTLHISWRP